MAILEITTPKRWAVDTSVAVPRLLESHPNHELVKQVIGNRKVHLSGHALAETYSILTRLPNVSLDAKQVAQVIDKNFLPVFLLPSKAFASIHQKFADRGIKGGAIYDGLVGLAAKENGATLLTMDTRASATYDALGVEVEIIAVS